MDVAQFHGFDWDSGNREKCQKHGLSTEEIEQVFSNRPHVLGDINHSETETRFLAIGRSNQGRFIFVAFTQRGSATKTLIRPISARYMHQKEIDHYENK